ncbi:54S ribosomal protein L10 mitochondrial [Meyerozyma sp. JA9]|nr:54S ribosomal protein L10 mitochondrial [Meyerozyma sp. JA9]
MLSFIQNLAGLKLSKPSSLLAIRNASYLGRLVPSEGAVKSYKRLGRGPASGKGKTSGRGQKGQKARGTIPRWFEGGQTPFYKRFPIVGFKRPHKRIFHELNLDRIQTFWNENRIPLEAGSTLTIKVMRDCGIITGSVKDGVKILANGADDYNVPLNIESSKASLGAIKAIEKTGSTYTSVYFTRLSLQAHLFPERFLLKKGYLPLPARPIHRRDIEFYSNEEKRGYLLKDRSILLDHMGQKSRTQKKARKSELTKQLEAASQKSHTDFSQTSVVDISKFA